jgi:hypothetical protein
MPLCVRQGGGTRLGICGSESELRQSRFNRRGVALEVGDNRRVCGQFRT